MSGGPIDALSEGCRTFDLALSIDVVAPLLLGIMVSGHLKIKSLSGPLKVPKGQRT